MMAQGQPDVVLPAGGIEWMRAGKGVWHAGGAGDPGLTRGFQLWVALPPHLELGDSESLYQSAADIPKVGPARVLLGSYDGATSAIEAPSSINACTSSRIIFARS